MKIENVDRSCSDCALHLKRRYGVLLHSAMVSDEDIVAMKMKPKEPVGWWMWLVFLLAAIIFGFLGSCLLMTATASADFVERSFFGIFGIVLLVPTALFAWFTVSDFTQFIHCNVIGYAEHVFHDGAGRLHIHLEEPIEIPSGHRLANLARFAGVCSSGGGKLSETAENPEAKKELVSGKLLKLRVGGWFRECTIPGDGCWGIGCCWNGLKDLRIVDGHGAVIDCATLTPDQAFMIIRTYGSVWNMIDNVERLAGAEKTADAARVAAERERDHLGVAIMAAIARMARDRKTLGASKHAQRIREQFEQALALLPTTDPDAREAIMMRWAEEAKKIVLAEEAEKAAAVAAPPPTATVEEKPAPPPEASGTATT